MTLRDVSIILISGISFCMLGVAISPKKTGTVLDDFNTKIYGTISNGYTTLIKNGYISSADPTIKQVLIFHKQKCVGIEFIISDNAFKNLPTDEKQNWRPLAKEIDSKGVYTEMYDQQNDYFINSLRNSYAKTIIFWHLNEDMPFTEPSLFNHLAISPNLKQEKGKR